MLSKKSKSNLYDICVSIFSATLIFFLIVSPKLSVTAAGNAAMMCLTSVIPSLFPFFVVSSCIMSTSLPQLLGKIVGRVTKPLFNISGSAASAIVLGMLGGCPIGAKTAADLFKKGLCTKEECERLMAFCNNCSPAFILSIAGSMVFNSTVIGLYLLLIHIASSLIVGVIFRFWKQSTPTKPCTHGLIHINRRPFADIFVDAVTTSFSSVLSVSGFIIFFSVIAAFLNNTGISNSLNNLLSLLFNIPVSGTFSAGIFEMTTGIISLAENTNIRFSLTVVSFLLGFGGMSIHFQAASVCPKNISHLPLHLGKLLHGLIAAVITYIFSDQFSALAVSSFNLQVSGSDSHFGIFVSFAFLLLSTAAVLCAKRCKK